MQWNANELAWAKKNNVTLGQKTKGGLMNVGAYRKQAGHPPQGGGGSGFNMQPAGGGGRVSAAGGGGGGQSLASYKGGGGGMGGNLLKAGAIGAGAGAASIAMGGLGSTAPFMAFGPAGIAAGAGLLALGMLSKDKKKDYHEAGGFGKTAGGFKQVGQVDPNTINWKQYVNDPINKDLKQAAESYRTGTASSSDIKYWQNRASSIGAGDVRQMSDEQFARLHFEFDAQGEGARESDYRLRVAQPKAAPAPRRRSAPAAPAPVEQAPTKAKKEEVSKPGSGLEDTIKNPPKEAVERPGLRPGVNAYNVPKSRKRRAGFFSYGGSMS